MISKAKYIIRIDDICPTINGSTWNSIVKILNKYDIKPIIAVIPDNRDKKFLENRYNSNFWNEVKEYQKNGWMIGLHGYDHVYITKKSGLLGISANSEFVGLDYDAQYEKIRKGKRIFEQYNIRVDTFVAPSHSIDKHTIRALKNSGIHLISDGLLIRPFYWHNIKWLPCQMWDCIKYKNSGIYTVCIHVTGWDKKQILEFEKNIIKFKDNIISPFSIKEYLPPKLRQIVWMYVYIYIIKSKRIMKYVLGNIHEIVKLIKK